MLFWILCLWAAADGFCDALYYARLGADSFAWNEHKALLVRRAAVLATACATAYDVAAHTHGMPLVWVAAQVVAFLPAFSLFHNEAYNFGRVVIIEQSAARAWAAFRFNYQSPTTTARFDFDGPSRWWLASAGVLLYLAAALIIAYLIV